MAATTVAVLVRTEELLDARERAVIAAFLAGYTGTTRISYTTDLRQFVTWCTNSGVRLLDVTRAHLETFARHMEADGRMRSTVARRLSTLASFYPVLPHRRRPRTQPRQPTSDPPKSTTNPEPSASTETSSAPSSSKPDSAHPATTPSSPCWP